MQNSQNGTWFCCLKDVHEKIYFSFSFFLNNFFVGKLLVHRYGIYCIAFTCRTKKNDNWNSLRSPRMWDWPNRTKDTEWCKTWKWFSLYIRMRNLDYPSWLQPPHNLNAVGQRWCQCNTERPPFFLSLSHAAERLNRVMEPNYRLFHLTGKGSPNRQTSYYIVFKRRVCARCAHGCASVWRTCFVSTFFSSQQIKRTHKYFPIDVSEKKN